MRRLMLAAVAVAIVGMSGIASAQTFMDDFESYAAGSQMHGQGGWKGWDNVAGAGAPVSNRYAYSGSKSVEIIGSADLVHEFRLAGGRWILTSMQYCPSGTSGITYFILLNTYNDGASAAKDWSVQTQYDLATGAITPWHGGTGSGAQILYDQWVELKFIINLGENTFEEYYDGELIAAGQWDDNAHGTLQCIDLYGNGASSVYYDDVRVEAYRILTANKPKPADGATGVGGPLLEWTKGDTAVLHDVYLGTSPELTAADRVGVRLPFTMYFHIPGLQPGVTYYWRVDEIEAAGTVHTGPVWSFTTAPLTAYEPSPRSGARGVDPAAVLLGWTGGQTAESHDVYFGTSQDDVANGTGDTFKGNQAPRTFDAGQLQANTTYYWRVDEIDSSGTKYAGAVWKFTTVSPTDGVKAEYFNGMAVSGAPVLTQTELGIDHSWGSGVVAANLSDAVSARWTAILEPFATGAYSLITTSDDGVRLWLDGRRIINNWTDHGTTDNRAKVNLVAGNTYLVVMEWYENGGGAVAQLSWEGPGIAREIIPAGVLQLPVRAASPYPGHGAVDVPQDVVLHWTAGDEATQHEVYFGQDSDAVASGTVPAVRQALDETTYSPGDLEWGKTYYWRVDEVNANGTPAKGSVWSFTTASFIVVDDFESYTDGIDGRIFQTWLDGLGYNEPVVVAGNGTGAIVGYVEAPFAEQRIVHGGMQSMPMDYNNVNAPYYSEAERTWAAPKNLAANGVDTLVLHVRGKSSNAAGRLYVAVKDNLGNVDSAANPNPDVLKSAEWIEWQVPLSELNAANTTAVKTMYIGVGDRNAPTKGGAGSLYVDDIWVIKTAE